MESSNWDVFISHASEDKDAVARPLAEKLRQLGLRVWYDEFELKVGDSLSRSIDKGLAKSEHGVVVLSQAFLQKNWPEYEIRGLTANSIGTERRILPVWHNVSRNDVLAFSPTLADVLAEKTDQSIDELALKLLSVLQPESHTAVLRKIAYRQEVSDAEPFQESAAAIRRSPIRHATLPRDLEVRVRLIRSALRLVYKGTVKEWMEGFQRDLHPEDEIAIWEEIAARYLAAVERVDLSKRERRELFQFLLKMSTEDPEKAAGVLAHWKRRKLEAVLAAMQPDPAVFRHEDDEFDQKTSENSLREPTIMVRRVGSDETYLKELAARLKFGSTLDKR